MSISSLDRQSHTPAGVESINARCFCWRDVVISNLFSFQNVSPVIRASVLRRTPGLARALDPVSARLTTAAMRRMNAEVDIEGRPPAEVAKAFLEREGLL